MAETLQALGFGEHPFWVLLNFAYAALIMAIPFLDGEADAPARRERP